MPVMRGRRALLEMLRAEGVEYVFGNPGTSESPIMDELESFPDLKYTLVMQEGVAMEWPTPTQGPRDGPRSSTCTSKRVWPTGSVSSTTRWREALLLS